MNILSLILLLSGTVSQTVIQWSSHSWQSFPTCMWASHPWSPTSERWRLETLSVRSLLTALCWRQMHHISCPDRYWLTLLVLVTVSLSNSTLTEQCLSISWTEKDGKALMSLVLESLTPRHIIALLPCIVVGSTLPLLIWFVVSPHIFCKCLAFFETVFCFFCLPRWFCGFWPLSYG